MTDVRRIQPPCRPTRDQPTTDSIAATIRLVVFDLDGTLVDSQQDLATAVNALIRERGGATLSEQQVGAMVGNGAAVLVRKALTAAGLDAAAPDALPRFLELYDAHLLDTTRAYAGMHETLAHLATRVPLAVLTNKPQAAAERLLDGLGLSRYFDSIVGGDTAAGRKPDPSGLLQIAARAGAGPGSTLLVGDSPIDLDTARRAGARICLARYGFGYRPVALEPGELAIDSPGEITQLL